MNEWFMLGVGLLLTIGTGLFVASEFALVNLNRNDLEKRRDAGESRLSLTISALKITSTHLSSAQLGITLTTLLTGYTFEPAVSSLLREPLEELGVPDSAVRGVGGVVGIVLATLFSMIIGELAPKNFALAVPRQTAKVVIGFQVLFTTVFKPVIVLLNGTANRIIRSMGIEPKEELSGARAPEELLSLIRHSASAGYLEQEEATLLDRSLRFSERDAADMMTPRVQMTAVHVDDTAAEVIAVAAASGHSRLPVVDEGPDDVVGLLHVKQAFTVPLDERDQRTARSLMVEPVVVPDTLGSSGLLEQLRGKGLQFAVVIDEYGGTSGVVTIEDLVEELIGELEDEHDRYRSPLTQRGRSVTFDASLRPDELVARTGVSVPEDDDWDTVAGFLSAELGRIPDVGDEVDVEGGLLRVTRTEGHRVSRVQFVPHNPQGEPTTDLAIHAETDGLLDERAEAAVPSSDRGKA